MNEIQLFNNPEFGNIRVIELNGTPYFVAKDLAVALGYAKPENAVATHVDPDDKTTTLIQGGGSNYKTHAIVVNESGLYALVFGSKLEKAKEFKHWVTSEVLPSIRKHGAYMTEPTLDKLLNDPDLVIGLATQLKEERAKVKAERERNEQLTATNAQLDLENKQQAHEIDQLKPIAAYAQMILNTPGLLTTTQIAKDYGKSAVWLNRMLKGLGVQYQQNGQYLLYSKYAGNGYTHTKMVDFIRHDGVRDSRPFTMWTQKGRMFVYELLKKNGIVPMVEQT